MLFVEDQRINFGDDGSGECVRNRSERVDISNDTVIRGGPAEILIPGLQLRVLRVYVSLKVGCSSGNGGLAFKERNFLVLLGRPTLEDLVFKSLNGLVHRLLEHDQRSPARDTVGTMVSFCRRRVDEGMRELDGWGFNAIQSRGVRLCMFVLAQLAQHRAR